MAPGSRPAAPFVDRRLVRREPRARRRRLNAQPLSPPPPGHYQRARDLLATHPPAHPFHRTVQTALHEHGDRRRRAAPRGATDSRRTHATALRQQSLLTDEQESHPNT
ncbi:hypothetical protein CF640_37480, partial [Burkholderia pseudomallei]